MNSSTTNSAPNCGIRAMDDKKHSKKHTSRKLRKIFAGICKKSIIAQRKTIFYLEMQIDSLEYKFQHNL